MRRFIAWLRALFTRKSKEDPYAGLNRAQRRALAFTKPGEQRMRLERTFFMQRARKRNKRKSDGGAKYRRAYVAGYRKGGHDALAELQKRAEQHFAKPRKLERAPAGAAAA